MTYKVFGGTLSLTQSINLPAEVNFSTINTFKRSIHCVDFSSFLRRYSL